MDREKAILLYELLADFEKYATECKKNEYDTNILYEIQKSINSANKIKQILALEF